MNSTLDLKVVEPNDVLMARGMTGSRTPISRSRARMNCFPSWSTMPRAILRLLWATCHRAAGRRHVASSACCW